MLNNLEVKMIREVFKNKVDLIKDAKESICNNELLNSDMKVDLIRTLEQHETKYNTLMNKILLEG